MIFHNSSASERIIKRCRNCHFGTLSDSQSGGFGDQKHYDVIIIGSGPAGYTAGIYASRAKSRHVNYIRHPAWWPAYDHK